MLSVVTSEGQGNRCPLPATHRKAGLLCLPRTSHETVVPVGIPHKVPLGHGIQIPSRPLPFSTSPPFSTSKYGRLCSSQDIQVKGIQSFKLLWYLYGSLAIRPSMLVPTTMMTTTLVTLPSCRWSHLLLVSVGLLSTSDITGLTPVTFSRKISKVLYPSAVVLHEQKNDGLMTESLSSMSTDFQAAFDDTAGNSNQEDEKGSIPSLCVIDFENISAPYMSRMDSESTFLEFTDDGFCVPAGPVGQFKENLANILREPFVELIIAASVLINSLLVALSTLSYLDPYMDWIRNAELFVSIVFCLDFLGRWVSSSKEYGRHILKPQFALDVVVVILPLMVGLTSPSFWNETPLPSGLTSPSGLVNLELLRVLRLRRVLSDLNTFERFMERALLGAVSERSVNLVQEWQLQLARVLLSLFTLVSVSTGLIYTAENGVNPYINNYFDALYFGLTTLTTVGFGDVSPVTWQGKLVVCGSILVGVAVVPAQAAALVEALLEREDQKRLSRKRSSKPISRSPNGYSPVEDNILALDTSRTCPECGASFHWTNAQYCYSCGEELE